MKDGEHSAIETSSNGCTIITHMTPSRGLPAKLSTLHRRQSVLNLPSHVVSDAGANETGQEAKPAFTLLNVQNDEILSQEEPSPTCRSNLNKTKNMMQLSNPFGVDMIDINPEHYESPSPDSQKRFRSSSTGHFRTLSIDFGLPAMPPSSVRLENLSSLKEQFLKIKERFSPSVFSLSSANTATVTPSSLITRTGIPNSGTASTPDILLTQSLSEHNEKNGGNWKLTQARVERWYCEDSFLKACITCPTMETGAAIVSKIARVVSEWDSTSGNISTSIANAINPDVSLQWMGQELWMVTVSLPLACSGDVRAMHSSFVDRVNEVVAEISHQAYTLSIELPKRAPLSSTPHAETAQVEIRDTSPSSSSQLTADDGELVLDEMSNVPSGPYTTLAPGDIEKLRMRELHAVNTTDSVRNDGVANNVSGDVNELMDRGRNDSDEEDSNELHAVAALPLSWSMLSVSSQASGSSEYAPLHGENLATTENNITDPVAHLPPDKTGWLKKKKRNQHGLGSAWQPRYFELKGNRLYYFTSEADGLPRGAVLLDHAFVQHGRGDHVMAFSISSASSHGRLQVLKFSARLAHQVLPRKSIELRVVEETTAAVGAWVAALNHASFYCRSASSTIESSAPLPAHSSLSFGPFSIPDTTRKTPFQRFRSSSATKAAIASASLSVSVDKERREKERAKWGATQATAVRSTSYQRLGSVQYLRETDPLLWEIHPPEQIAIRKKAARARTRSDYLAIFSRHSKTFAQIFLPKPQPISLEQILRDILPELFLINDTLYGGGEHHQEQQAGEQYGASCTEKPRQHRGLEHIFEVLDTHIQRFAAAPEARVRAISALLQACARTISGGDSYFVVHRLLGNPNLIIRPAEARGRPIEIDVSPNRPCHFLITVFSAFSFHRLEDVERFGDMTNVDGSSSTPAPLLGIRTRHVQEFDFENNTSTRWLKIDVKGRKEDGSSGGGPGSLGRWGSRRHSREIAESKIGALLDPLS